MSYKHIKTLSMNPHFYSKLLQGFLTGYENSCELRLFFMALPILLNKDLRIRLANANARSRLDSIFKAEKILDNEAKISGKIGIASFLNRFDELKDSSKKALIILSSESKISINNNSIALKTAIKYADYNGGLREWLKAAYYLGKIFAKSDIVHLYYYLGVEIS